jgi:hypothetical protein
MKRNWILPQAPAHGTTNTRVSHVLDVFMVVLTGTVDSAYIFVGGLNYELTEGDVVAVFSQ